LEKYIELMDVLDELIIDNYSESLELIKPVKIIKDYIGDNEELIRKTTIVIRSPKEILTSRGGDSPNRKEIEKQENVSCLAPYQQLIIRPDGKVSLCCNDVLGRYTMGDLNEKTVSEIWYGEEFARVRKNLLSGRDKEAHCQYCDTYLWQWSMEKHKILAKV
jgi:radical SAM protein with 4Fe4S-binding SPASM domain